MTAQTILPANSAASGGFDVANSVRLSGTNDYFHKTPSSSGSRRLFTFSAWVKKADFSTGVLFSSGEADGNPNLALYFDSSSRINMYSTQGMQYITTRVFKDPSAWYHIVFVVDTANGTENDRQQLYVNGVRETVFSTSNVIGQNENLSINTSAYRMAVGTGVDDEDYFGGYMAEVVFLDNQASPAASFGEFDSDSGIWKPKNVNPLTFGTNGFYLNFQDSSNLGNDVNGGTDLTEVNLAATDQSIDTCTNNFVTGNPIAAQGGSAQSDSLLTFTEGNLLMAANSETGIATIGVSAGKWYWEVKVIADQDGLIIGACNEHFNINAELGYNSPSSPSAAKIFGYYGGNGNSMIVVGDGTSQSYGTALAVNDIIGVALDVDSADQTCTFYLNGSSQGSLDITNLGSGESYFPAVGNWSAADVSTSWNFGSPAFAISSGNADANDHGNFEYEVPSGYFALNTKNLAEYG